MYEVKSRELIAPDVYKMTLLAPRIASARKPGQFVIVRAEEGDERIPLTIADADPGAGTVTIIVQAVGYGTRRIASREAGEFIRDLAGPLGRPTEIKNFGRVTCIGGGVGTAVLFPLARALADAGNEVTAIIGGRSSEHIILREELSEFCHRILVTTEDGSAGTKGFVTAVLDEILDDGSKLPGAVYAVGPVPMMKAVVDRTSPAGIKTIVSLNPIMVDGTGMCGGCRVTVGGEVKFACVDGPEFDGSLVDFDELSRRRATYENHECKLDEKLQPDRE